MLVLVDVLTCFAMWERRVSEVEEQWIDTVDFQDPFPLFTIFRLWPDPLLPAPFYQFNGTFPYTDAPGLNLSKCRRLVSPLIFVTTRVILAANHAYIFSFVSVSEFARKTTLGTDFSSF